MVTPTEVIDQELLTIRVTPAGITLNDEAMDVPTLETELAMRLEAREDKTVVIVPHDDVLLGTVVEVLDVAKASGAQGLAMLNEIGE